MDHRNIAINRVTDHCRYTISNWQEQANIRIFSKKRICINVGQVNCSMPAINCDYFVIGLIVTVNYVLVDDISVI